jgi:hypothetical protein
MSRAFALVALLVALFTVSPVLAQSSILAGSVLVIPVVAQTGSYTTEVFVRNFAFPTSTAITINVRFYEAVTSTSPGLRPCTQLVVQPQQTARFTLATQCTLGGGPNHGMLILENAAVEKTNFFSAYSRTQTPSGNGFSVEAFNVGNFSGQGATVLGVKRVAVSPIYQTNCFVAALGEAVDYAIGVRDGPTNAVIGTDLTGALQPYEMRRYLDIYTHVGAPAGDHADNRVVFYKDPASSIVGNPAFVAFCTVQESTYFGADFRIAKSFNSNNNRELRFTCYGQSACGTLDNTVSIPNNATKNINYIIIAPPDEVRCELVSPRVNELELKLRGPGDSLLAPDWPSAPPFTSGGNNQTFIYMSTGQRSTVSGGFTNRWFLDISAREGLPGGTVYPIPYGITCWSGNGITFPWFRASTADDF